MSLLGADSDVHSLAPEQCWNYTDPLGRAQARHHLRLILPMMRTQMRPPPRPGMISQTAQQQAAAQAQVNISQVAQQAPPIAIATPQRIQPAQTQHMRISAGRTPSQTSPPTSAHSATPLSVQQGSPIAPQPTHLPNLAPAPSQPGTPRIPITRTLGIIKSHALKDRLDIERRIVEAGFEVSLPAHLLHSRRTGFR